MRTLRTLYGQIIGYRCLHRRNLEFLILKKFTFSQGVHAHLTHFVWTNHIFTRGACAPYALCMDTPLTHLTLVVCLTLWILTHMPIDFALIKLNKLIPATS